ncbi:DUF2917 domain-containing protein [Noviherbaspirillum sp. UKPF54]|uniref:DUF2917 domain-containing protein n=1 Tax=Noviherbaspirillum sp. UKPF54 TaxID=2601898 RepID=UPI0011B123C7|nr:DUF2917 domain-containing protein [Noviherbaspirillum sp. UKPF54]QDZ29857.1 DUF2917 domain-containing protein [Noviherbaspirillum sp. UKPF54]
MQPKILAATQSGVECELHEGYPLRLVGARGRRVQCLAGIVWITACNQPADIFLKPGQSFVIPNGGLALAEAIGHGRMRVDLPRSLHYAAYRMPAGLLRTVRALQAALVRLKVSI